MHPHVLLETADLITQERLARSAQRRLASRARRRAAAPSRLRTAMVAVATAARGRASSVGADAEPATCVPSP